MLRSLEQAREILKQQPFSQLLETELLDYTEEHVSLSVPVTDKVTQHFGFAHGGLVAFLADVSLTFAGGIALGPKVITSEFKINFLRPGIGQTLIAEASVLGAGKRQAVTQTKIYAINNDTRKLCAVAQGTIVKLED
ncbi:PaaI family thioesterase [Brackiella oedipodis]|uniref:PaaI family thioesterase n=1 Tax=Brackiella oedipodis TaxID=124225 RepID=UPI00048E5F8F|nr:PaaI family thioesterase [Brackiella oedipodis]